MSMLDAWAVPKQFDHALASASKSCSLLDQAQRNTYKFILRNFKLFSPCFQSQSSVLCTHVHTYTRFSRQRILSTDIQNFSFWVLFWNKLIKWSLYWLTLPNGSLALALVNGGVSSSSRSDMCRIQPYMRFECKPTSEDLNSVSCSWQVHFP